MEMRVVCTSINFYPRSPCGERRIVIPDAGISEMISIHALLAESDLATWKPDYICRISIHALLAESDIAISSSTVARI